MITNQPLYQLSYIGTPTFPLAKDIIAEIKRKVNQFFKREFRVNFGLREPSGPRRGGAFARRNGALPGTLIQAIAGQSAMACMFEIIS